MAHHSQLTAHRSPLTAHTSWKNGKNNVIFLGKTEEHYTFAQKNAFYIKQIIKTNAFYTKQIWEIFVFHINQKADPEPPIRIGHSACTNWNDSWMLRSEPTRHPPHRWIRKGSWRFQGRWQMDIWGRRRKEIICTDCRCTRLLHLGRRHRDATRKQATSLDDWAVILSYERWTIGC